MTNLSFLYLVLCLLSWGRSLQRRNPGHLSRKPELGRPDPPGCGIELLLADSKTFLDQFLGQGSLGFGSALRGAGWEPELGTKQEASREAAIKLPYGGREHSSSLFTCEGRACRLFPGD